MLKKLIIFGIIISLCAPSRTLCYGNDINSSNLILNGLVSFCLCLEVCCIYAITNDIYRRINQDPEAKPADLWRRPAACVGAAAPPTLGYPRSHSRYSYISGRSQTYEKSFDEYALGVSTFGSENYSCATFNRLWHRCVSILHTDSPAGSDPHS